MSIRVLVADDHALFRRGLAAVIRDCGDLKVVGEACNGDEATRQAAALRPDVIVMDLSMPGTDGLEATRQILAADAAARIIILTVSADDRHVFEAIKAGARAYLLKDVDPDELIRTVRGVAEGEAFVSPTLAGRILRELVRRPADALSGGRGLLTSRELEVLALISRGQVNKEIAAALGISLNTVKNHLKNIMEKLHLENRVQLAAYAHRQGLAGGPPPS